MSPLTLFKKAGEIILNILYRHLMVIRGDLTKLINFYATLMTLYSYYECLLL